MSSYDQNLLGEVPKATRAQLQEGYNVDLLEQPPPRRTPSVRNPPPPTPQPVPVTMPLMSGVPETGSGEKFESPTHNLSAVPEPRTSFWRSRNGVITIAVIVLVVIGAVVGGAVGGTVGKSNKTANTTGTHSTSASNPFITLLSSSTSASVNTQDIAGLSKTGSSAATPTSTAGQSSNQQGGSS